MKKFFTYTLLLICLSAHFFNSRAQTVNFNLMCVDSVWYMPGDSIFINVRIFNGDTNQINYPSVQIVSPANDTIGNPSNYVNYFAQLGNTYLTYTDTITQAGIPDFSNYTFLMSEGFGDTTVVITWCGPLSVAELSENELEIFPNPVTDKLFISGQSQGSIETIEFYDATGKLILSRHIKEGTKNHIAIDISDFAGGIYFIRAIGERKTLYAKFVKQ